MRVALLIAGLLLVYQWGRLRILPLIPLLWCLGSSLAGALGGIAGLLVLLLYSRPLEALAYGVALARPLLALAWSPLSRLMVVLASVLVALALLHLGRPGRVALGLALILGAVAT